MEIPKEDWNLIKEILEEKIDEARETIEQEYLALADKKTFLEKEEEELKEYEEKINKITFVLGRIYSITERLKKY